MIAFLVLATFFAFVVGPESSDIPADAATITTAGSSLTFSYTGSAQTFTTTYAGYYHFECWGAQGGNSNGVYGLGGYAAGTIYLGANVTFYIYVGQKGNDGNVYQGYSFNGGGGSNYSSGTAAGQGGGATDIRLSSGNWNDTTGLRSRIMVAGGGGGHGDGSSTINNGYGRGGGTSGGDGNTYNPSSTVPTDRRGRGGTQTAGGAGGSGYNSSYPSSAGSFGYGGLGGRVSSDSDNHTGGGGGGGYYGGGGAVWHAQGGGGSSFISGLSGCNAVNSSGAHTGRATHYSGYSFINGVTTAGVRAGNGQVIITYAKTISSVGSSVSFAADRDIGQLFVATKTGNYTIECKGGAGSYNNAVTTYGYGATVKGTVTLSQGTILYVYVGKSGVNGGYNGGGTNSSGDRRGGGASDVRLSCGFWNDSTGLSSRIIVAGGGGGHNDQSNNSSNGGHGGIFNGGSGVYHSSCSNYQGGGGTQSAGGSPFSNASSEGATSGGFGYGGNAGNHGDGHQGGGGGGGYYGGAGSAWHAGGGGGSSYIAGGTISSTSFAAHSSALAFSSCSGTAGNCSGNGSVSITFTSCPTYDIIYDANGGSANTAIRYIREYTTANNVNAAGHIDELQAIEFNGVNEALYTKNANVKVNGSTPSFPGNSDNTGAPVDGLFISAPWYSITTLTIDLGSTYTLDYIRLLHYPYRYYYQTKTEVSVDGTNWSTVYYSGSTSNAVAYGTLLEQLCGYTVQVNSTSTRPMHTVYRDRAQTLRTNVVYRTNYDLLGWSTSSTATSATYANGASVNNIASAGGSVTLYAVWRGVQTTVTLNNQSATSAGTTSVTGTYNSNLPSITVPSRVGYTFGGYYTGTGGGGTQYINASGAATRAWDKTSNTTLYAKWTPNNYTVKYYGNGGSTTDASKTVTYDSTYGTLTTASRTGYTFSNWVYGTTRGNVTLTAGSSNNYCFDNAFAALTPGATYTVVFDKATLTAHSTNNPSAFAILIYDFDANAVRASTSKAFGSSIYWTFTVPTSTSSTNTKLIYYSGINGATANNTVAFEGIYLFAHATTVTSSTTYNKAAANTGLLALWTPNNYTVKYYGNGGSTSAASKTVTYDSTYGTLATASRTGYTFNNWVYGTPLGSPTLTAGTGQWCYNNGFAALALGKTYTITFGKATLTAHSTYNPTQFTILIYDFDAPAQRAGYTLNFGSNLSLTFTVPSSGTSTTNTRVIFYAGIAGNTSGNTVAFEDVNLFAHSTPVTASTAYTTAGNSALLALWTANTYNVVYNGNKPDAASATVGSIPAQATWTYDSNATLGSAPTLTGWTFNGWYKDSGGGTLSGSAGATLTKPNYASAQGATVNLYAKWTANSYTVSYALNGGSAGTSAPTAWTYDAVKELSAPSRTGYTFTGWKVTSGLNTSTAKWGTSSSPATAISATTTNLFNTATTSIYLKNLTPTASATVTVTAYWEANTYSVSYSLSSGGVTGASAPTAWTYDAAQEVSAPSRTGYTFTGWKVTSGLNTSTAKWGTSSSPATAIDSSTVCANGATGGVYFKNLTPTRNGSITLTAQWQVHTYTVTYAYGRGTNGASAPTAWTYDAVQYVSAPSKAGYTFTGWTVTSGLNTSTAKYGTTDATGTAISSTGLKCINGVSGNVYFKNLTPNANGAVTLTATWSVNNYTISYNAQGGTVTGSQSKTQAYESTYGELPTPSRAGYTFLGWRLLPEGYQQVEYIEATGGGYVVTDVTPGGYGTMRVVAEPTATGINQSFWVARGSSSVDKAYTLFGISGGNYRFDYNGGNTNTQSWSKSKVTLTAERNRLYVGTTAGYAYTQANFTAGGPFMFMASYAGGTSNGLSNYSQMKFYGATYWDGGSIVSYFVPCYRTSDNKVGLYDVVGGKFYGCTGTLSKGSNVYVTSGMEFVAGKDVTLYAVWSAKSYTVTYNAGSGTVTPASKSVTFGNAYGTLATPTRTGYTFVGWRILPEGYTQVEYLEAAGGGHILTTDGLTNDSSIRYVMMVTANVGSTQTVFCARGSGGLQDKTMTTFLVNSNLRYDYNTVMGSDNTLTPVQGDKLIYSVEKNTAWAKTGTGLTYVQAHAYGSYTVGGPLMFLSSYSGGNTGTVTNRAYMRFYGATVWNGGEVTHYYIPCFNSEGKNGVYDIIGGKFYEASGTLTRGGTKYVVAGDEYAVGANVTLYAVWSANKYTLTFDGNFPSTHGNTTGTTSIDAYYDSMVPTIVPPSKAGFTFVGYYINEVQYYGAGGGGVRAWTTAGNATLTARWTMNAVSITMKIGNEAGTSFTVGTTYTEPYNTGGKKLSVDPTHGCTDVSYTILWTVNEGSEEQRTTQMISARTDLLPGAYVYSVRVTATVGGYSVYADGVITGTITKKSLTDTTMTIALENFTYCGAPRSKLTVTDANTEGALTAGSHYTAVYPADITNAGTKTVTITGAGDYYTGSVTRTYTISPKALSLASGSDFTLTIQGGPFVYKAAEWRPVVEIVSLQNPVATLVAGASSEGDYTITGYQNNINSGMATITIVGTNNYTGTIQKEFLINKAVLTVTADDKVITYGDEVPTYTVTITGFKETENVPVVSGSCAYDSGYAVGSNAGTYTITPYATDMTFLYLTTTPINYEFEYVAGTLTVNKKGLRLTAEDVGCVYGDPQPEVTITPTGLYSGDTLAGVITNHYVMDYHGYEQGANADEYVIEPVVSELMNYVVTVVPGTLRVSKRELTVTAWSMTIAYYAAVPEYGYTITGWYGTDEGSAEAIIGETKPSVSCSYEVGGAPGEYVIYTSVAGVNATNYSFIGVNGTLKVSVGVLTLEFSGIVSEGYYEYDGTSKEMTAVVTDGLSTADEGGEIEVRLAYYRRTGTDPVTEEWIYSEEADPVHKDAGTYKVMLGGIVINGVDMTECYESESYGTMTVDKTIARVIINRPSANVVYNGEAQPCSYTISMGYGDSMTGSITLGYRYGGVDGSNVASPIKAGVYYVYAVTDGFGFASGVNIDNYVRIAYDVLGDHIDEYGVEDPNKRDYYVIEKKEATITTTDITTIYGVMGTPGYVAEGILAADLTDLEDSSISGRQYNYLYEGIPQSAEALKTFAVGEYAVLLSPVESARIKVNYNLNVIAGVLRVNKRRIVITANDEQRVYVGGAQVATVTIAGDGLLAGEEVRAVFSYNGAATAVDVEVYDIVITSAHVYKTGTENVCDNHYEYVYTYFAAEVTEGATIPAGTYYERDGEEYLITSDGEFIGGKDYYTKVSGTLEITPAPITLSSESIVYDGKVRSLSKYDQSVQQDGAWRYVEGLFNDDVLGDAVLSYSSTPRDVGTYTVTATSFTMESGLVKNYYIVPWTLEITPKPIVIWVNSREEIFNDCDYEGTATYEIGEGDLIEFSYVYTLGAASNVNGARGYGVWEVTIDAESIRIKDGEGNDRMANYGAVPTLYAGEITVNKRVLVVTVGTQNVTYDGEVQGVTATVSNWATNGIHPTITFSFGYSQNNEAVTPVAVGNYAVSIALDTFSPAEQLINYAFDFDTEGVLVIADRGLTFSISDLLIDAYTYNGEACIPPDGKITIGGDGLVGGDSVVYTWAFRLQGEEEWLDEAIYYGTYDVRLAGVQVEGTGSGYSIGAMPVETFEITVNKRVINVSVSGAAQVYDGTNRQAVLLGEANELVEGDRIEGTFTYDSVTTREVGTYTVTSIDSITFYKGERDITDSYMVATRTLGAFDVIPLTLVLTIPDVISGTEGYVYDGTAKEAAVTTNIGAGDSFEYELSYEKVGSSETDHIGAGNWKVSLTSFTFGAGVNVANYGSDVYVQFTSVSEQVIYGSILQSNHYSIMTIDRREATVTVISYDSAIYDKQTHPLSVSYDNLVEGESFEANLLYVYNNNESERYNDRDAENNLPVNAGTYTVSVNGLIPVSGDLSNYSFTYVPGELTINKHVVYLGIREPASSSIPFDNNYHTLGLVIPNGLPDAISVTATMMYAKDGGMPTTNPAKENGHWVVTIGNAQMSTDVAAETRNLWNRNYTLNITDGDSVQQEFDIGELQIMLTMRETEVVYTGSGQYPVFTHTSLLDVNDQMWITYRIAYNGSYMYVRITTRYNGSVDKIELDNNYTSSMSAPPTNVGDYQINIISITYAYKEGGSDHSGWYDIGQTREYLTNTNNGEESWRYSIRPKEVTVTVNSIAAGTPKYVFDGTVHTTTAGAIGVNNVPLTDSDFRYTLLYSMSSSIGSGTWVMQDIAGTWKVVRNSSLEEERDATTEEIPTSAGTWNIIIKEVNGFNANYSFRYQERTIAGTMVVDPRDTRLGFAENINIEYDGQEHRLAIIATPELRGNDSVTATLEYCEIAAYENDPTGAVWTESISGVGDYYVRIKQNTIITVGNMNNYRFIYPGEDEYGELCISPRKVTFTIDDLEEVYTGESHAPNATAHRILDEDAAIIRAVVTGFLYTGENGPGDNVNVNGGDCYAKVNAATFVKAAPGVSNELFEATCAKYTWNFEKADPTEGRVTITKATLGIEIEFKRTVYNGEAQTTNATVSGLCGLDTAAVELSYSNNVDAGTCSVGVYNARITSGNAGNYEFVDFSEVRGSIIIESYKVVARLAYTEAVYDGRAKEINVTLEDENGDATLLFGNDIDYFVKTITYQKGRIITRTPSDAGEWTATIQGAGISDTDRAGNYEFTYSVAEETLKILPSTYDFTHLLEYMETVGYLFSAEFNGEGQVPDFQSEIPQGADSNNYVLRAIFVDDDGAPITVTEVSDVPTKMHVYFRTFTNSGVQVDSTNYEVPTEEFDVWFNLTAMTLAVEWGPIIKRVDDEEYVEIQYNGTAARPVAKVTGVDGSVYTLVVTVPSGFDGMVSDVAYDATAAFDESLEMSNYTLTNKRMKFKVVKKRVAIQFYGYSGLVYNGREQSISVKIQDGGLVGEDRLPLVIRYNKDMVRDAGNYTAWVYIDTEQAGDVLNNYELDTNITFSFTIAPCPATVTANDLSSVYGASQLSLRGRYTTSGFFESDLRYLSVTLTKEFGSEVGKYAIKPTAELANYTITCIPGTYTILPKDITVIVHDQKQLDPLSSDLSQEQGVAWDVKEANGIIGSDKLGINLYTSVDLNDPAIKYGVIVPSASNANYNITFVGDPDEEGVYAPYGKFIITKTQAVLSIRESFKRNYPNDSKVYDGEIVRVLVENTGGTTPTYIINGVAGGNTFSEPGVYNIIVKATAKEQYYPPEDLYYTFTIYPNQIETEFGDYKATVTDENGYSTTATFSLVEDKTAESDIIATFAGSEAAANKQITDFYFIQSDGDLSGNIELDLSAEYNNGDKVTLYIYKRNGEYAIETYEVRNGIIILKNAEEIEGIGFIKDDNGPGFMTILMFIIGGVVLLALILLPILARRR